MMNKEKYMRHQPVDIFRGKKSSLKALQALVRWYTCFWIESMWINDDSESIFKSGLLQSLYVFIEINAISPRKFFRLKSIYCQNVLKEMCIIIDKCRDFVLVFIQRNRKQSKQIGSNRLLPDDQWSIHVWHWFDTWRNNPR